MVTECSDEQEISIDDFLLVLMFQKLMLCIQLGFGQMYDIRVSLLQNNMYRQVSNISRTLVGNKIVDHSDVVGASPVGAAPTTSSF